MKILFPLAAVGLLFLSIFVWTNLDSDGNTLDADKNRPTSTQVQLEEETKAGVGPIAEYVGDNFYDFGIKEPGFEYSYVFSIRNTGDEVLKLTKGRKTCDCASIEIFDHEIEPGEIGRVELTWEARYSKEDFHEGFSLRTNMRDRRELSISAKGVVSILARAVPGLFKIGSISKGDRITGSTIVFSQLWDEVVIHQVESSIDGIEHQVSSAATTDVSHLEAKTAVRFSFSSPPTEDKGEFNHFIRLMVSGSPDTPKSDWLALELIARGSVLGRYSITGDQFNHYNEVDLRSLRADREHESPFMMRIIAAPKEVAAPTVTSYPAGIQLNWIPVNPEHGIYKAVIKIPKGLEQGDYQTGENQAWIKLNFDHPEIDEITVPIVLRLYAPSADVDY